MTGTVLDSRFSCGQDKIPALVELPLSRNRNNEFALAFMVCKALFLRGNPIEYSVLTQYCRSRIVLI